MNTNKIEERTAELITEYNSYQNPEAVIALMAHWIATLEDKGEKLLSQVETNNDFYYSAEADVNYLTNMNAELSDLVGILEDRIDGLFSDIKDMEIEIREAYRDGEQAGRESCDGRY